MVSRVSELIEKHWEYVAELLRVHGEDDAVIEKIGFHYRSSGIHFYKHGVVDCENGET